MEKKECIYCHFEKTIDNFSKYRKKYNDYCKDCRPIHLKELKKKQNENYKNKNPDYQKKYKETNREEINKKAREKYKEVSKKKNKSQENLKESKKDNKIDKNNLIEDCDEKIKNEKISNNCEIDNEQEKDNFDNIEIKIKTNVKKINSENESQKNDKKEKLSDSTEKIKNKKIGKCSKCPNNNIELVKNRTICKECLNNEKKQQRINRNLPEREGICTKCHELKILPKNKYWCRGCKNDNNNKSRNKNKEKINEKEREAYHKKKEEVKDKIIVDDITETKMCTECEKEKTLDNFYLHKGKGTVRAWCKECTKKKRNEAYPDNKEKINSTRRKLESKKRKTDPAYKLEKNMRNRLYHAIKNQKTTKSSTTFKLVGCNKNDLKIYLEKRFTDGMTWENYGVWHVDHIKPCQLFDLEKEDEQKECFHYTNLRPLWGDINISRGKKMNLEDKKLLEKERKDFIKYLLDNNLDKPAWLHNSI